MRRRDRLSIVLALGLAAAMLVVAFANLNLRAQTQSREALQYQTDSIDHRVERLENQRLDARLLVLEDVASRSGRVENLIYAALFGVAGNLLLLAFQIAFQVRQRKVAADDGDGDRPWLHR